MQKRILIDVTVLAQGTHTGVFRVTLELVRHLLKLESAEVYFTLTQEQQFLERGLDLREGLQAFSRAHGLKAPFISSEIEPAFTDIDVYVSTFFKVPDLWAREKRVHKAVMVYDLIPVLHPEYCQDGIHGLMEEFFQHLEADWSLFAISEATRQDLLAYRPDIPAKNIHVTHLGADDRFRPRDDADALDDLRKKYNIPISRPYVLSVATLEIRKNLIAVLDGFAEYIRVSEDSDSLLVLSGMTGWKLDNLSEEIAQRPELDDRVVLTGFVDDEDLPFLYSGAALFVFMSFYEGFGLPPLEAMSCGIPVIASNRSSLPEVVGDAGFLLDPEDTKGLASAMQAILSDRALHQSLSEKSLTMAAQFSWDRFGDQVNMQLAKLPKRDTPYLSIITICYNEKDLRDTCESVINQTYEDFEWIVIDGGSDEATLSVLKEYQDHMTHMVSEPDDGRYDAMNKGIRASRGKYLQFLNAGDYLHGPKTLETIFRYSAPFDMMNLFGLKLNAEIVYGEVIARETGMMPHPMWRTGPQTHDIDFFAGNSLPHQATFIQRSLFERFGLYDDNLLYAADYEWFIRALAFHGVRSQYLPVIVSVYNFEGTSSTSVAADAPHIVEIQKVFAHYSSPETHSDWPSRNDEQPFGETGSSDHEPVTTLQSENSVDLPGPGAAVHTKAQEHFSSDLEFVRRLLDVSASRTSEDKLCVLIDQCNDVLYATHRGAPCPTYDISFDTECQGFNALRLFIARMSRSLAACALDTDRVPHRRALMFMKERLVCALQETITAPESSGLSDAHDAQASHMGFAYSMGLTLPPLVERDEYHLAQLALRSIAREKFTSSTAQKGTQV